MSVFLQHWVLLEVMCLSGFLQHWVLLDIMCLFSYNTGSCRRSCVCFPTTLGLVGGAVVWCFSTTLKKSREGADNKEGVVNSEGAENSDGVENRGGVENCEGVENREGAVKGLREEVENRERVENKEGVQNKLEHPEHGVLHLDFDIFLRAVIQMENPDRS